MLDEPVHGPVHARSRRGPLVGLDRTDQLADCCERTNESVELDVVVYGHEGHLSQVAPPGKLPSGQHTPGGAKAVIDTERRTSSQLERATMTLPHQPCGRAEAY